MIINISKQEVDLLYSKAEKSYYKCIQNKENAFLEKESPTLFTSVELTHECIKVVFSGENIESYTYEITLHLWDSTAELVGNYVYIEDNNGDMRDDSLVFF